jgi:large subunit ribosomal protein L3
MPGLIAKKIGMSRVFKEDGEAVPVTYLAVEPNKIVRHRMKDRDGYDAIVLGVDPKKWKTRKGLEHTKYRTEKEFIVDSLDGMDIGKEITVDSIPAESMVTVIGISKGKGFAGVIKRHNFSRGPETHGSHHHREPGSVGMCDMPGKVLKGKKMPGRMGREQVTRRNCSVMISDPKGGVLAVKGPVPGPNGTTVFLKIESPPNT